jgi:hypothetical protein
MAPSQLAEASVVLQTRSLHPTLERMAMRKQIRRRKNAVTKKWEYARRLPKP